MSKTPRTLLENYIDASKTQTVKVTRNKHVGLVRTPDIQPSQEQSLSRSGVTHSPYTQSPRRNPERYGGSNKRVSRTPEPYMHTGGKSMPQHDRVSTLRSNRRSVSKSDGEETPRQLLQGFLESEDTTAPLVRYKSRTSQGRLSSSQPAIPLSGRRSSVAKHGNWTVNMDSDTPRTLLQNYVLNTTAAFETPAPRQPRQQTPDLPVRQDSYQTPSPFKTYSTGSEGMDEMVIPSSVRGRTPRSSGRRRGTFSISTLDRINQTLEESVIPPTNPDDYQTPSPFCSSSSDEESHVAETTYATSQSHNRSRHHQGNFNISIPDAMKEEISLFRQSQKRDRENLNELQNQSGKLEEERGSDSEPDYEYEPESTRMSMKNPHVTSMLPDGMEYTMPLNDDETETSPVISDKGRESSFLADDFNTPRNERNEDFRQIGRWSEGHKSRLESPGGSSDRSGQSHGHRRSLPAWSSMQQQSPYREQRLRHSEMNREPEQLANIEEFFIAEKLHNQSIHNISSNFSPRITSTQRAVTMETDIEDRPLPTVTPSPVVSPNASPRSLTPTSPRLSISRVLTPSTRSNIPSPSSSASDRSSVSRSSSRRSRSRASTPSQTVKLEGSRYLTPGSSVRQRSRSRSLTPLQTVSPSPVVSSGGGDLVESPRNRALKPSSRISRTPSQIQEQRSVRQDGEQLGMSRLLQDRPRSDVGNLSSRSSVTSPVVASRKSAPDMANTLPNNTANFSPPIASTQNIAALSRLGHKTAEKLPMENTDIPDDDGQWEDEMDQDHADEGNEPRPQGQNLSTKSTQPVKKPRKPRQKSNYSLPVNLVKKQFTHFAGLRVTKEAIEEVMKVSEKYWDILARDLEAYAKHAGRKQINMSDFVLLFKRQGYVSEKQSLKSLIEKYLPMEEREKLISVARAGNRIEPKL